MYKANIVLSRINTWYYICVLNYNLDVIFVHFKWLAGILQCIAKRLSTQVGNASVSIVTDHCWSKLYSLCVELYSLCIFLLCNDSSVINTNNNYNALFTYYVQYMQVLLWMKIISICMLCGVHVTTRLGYFCIRCM